MDFKILEEQLFSPIVRSIDIAKSEESWDDDKIKRLAIVIILGAAFTSASVASFTGTTISNKRKNSVLDDSEPLSCIKFGRKSTLLLINKQIIK